jgi:SAM-dependent methyltransferase
LDTEVYETMADHEGHHWWFVGRRAVIQALLDRLPLPPQAKILEAGCGTGGNVAFLSGLGEVSAFEPHGRAVEIARGRHPDVLFESGSLPGELPFPPASFDLVAALDVLEHVDDDERAFGALTALARPGGYVLITVPTHPFLWGRHDLRLHHVRRYDVHGFRALCERSEARIEYFGAFNTLLSPVAFAARIAEKVLPLDFGNQERLPPAPLNAVLARVFALEGRLVRSVHLPLGLSHAAILRRP